ncbi:hypothetical protein Q0S20_26260, partial [Escherichia coli O2:H6]
IADIKNGEKRPIILALTIPDDIDNAPVLFAAVTRTPNVKITGHIWKPMWNRGICWNVKGPPVIITLIQGAAWNSENKPR